MKYKDESNFHSAVKAGERHRVYLLYGSEAYLIEKWADKLLGGDAASPFNSQRLDGAAPDLEALGDALEALPMFAQEKHVLLDGLDPAKLTEGDLDVLGVLLGDVPESTTLVITAKAAGFATSPGGKKLIKLAEAHGAAVELSIRGQADLVKFLQAGAKKLGCELNADCARHMLNICPADMLLLENELNKACAYAGGGQVTRAHIDAVVTPKTEARAFDLQRFILAGNAAGALGLLASLFHLREDPIAITGALSMGFCDLYRARAARDAGQGSAALGKDYGIKSEYRARKAFENAGKLSTPAARRAVKLLRETDEAMKSTGVDNKIYLEQLSVRLISLCWEGR